jgi:carboxypeptidase Q
LIGLGGTVSGNVKAEVIVVKNYTELDSKKDLVKGKIVLFNHDWVNYG